MARKPYLLSTAATLREFGILDYDGYDFSMRRDRHRSYRAPVLKKLILEFLYETIVPNAIIAKQSGRYIEWKDAMTALEYAMTKGKSKESVDAFNDFYKAHKADWFFTHVKRPVKFYAFDTPFNTKTGEFYYVLRGLRAAPVLITRPAPHPATAPVVESHTLLLQEPIQGLVELSAGALEPAQVTDSSLPLVAELGGVIQHRQQQDNGYDEHNDDYSG